MEEAGGALVVKVLKGVKIFNKTDNAGSFGGAWLHFELEMHLATDSKAMEAAWRALPKPNSDKA
jgi:hypothetical protein